MSPKNLPLSLSLLSFAVFAGEPPRVDLEPEPCVNGEVSISGALPTQAMGAPIDAFLPWTMDIGHFYYLLGSAGNRLPDTQRNR